MLGPYNFYMIEKLAAYRQRSLMKEAELYRLASQTTPSDNLLLVRAAWTLGAIVIALGTWLQNRPGGIHYR